MKMCLYRGFSRIVLVLKQMENKKVRRLLKIILSAIGWTAVDVEEQFGLFLSFGWFSEAVVGMLARI